MARALPFAFEEVLPHGTQGRLPTILKISGTSDPEILLLIRLLSGALSVEHIYTGQKIDQTINFFTPDFQEFRDAWDIEFPKTLGEDITSSDFEVYIKETRFKNRVFFKNILLELCNFFLHTQRGSHTAAFIYVYRFLENIAYAFPLIYVSKTDDFTRTFNFLKGLFVENKEDKGDKGDKEKGKEKGELGFYKSFVQAIYKGDPLAESSVDFNIAASDIRVQKSMFNTLNEISQKMQSDATESPRKLSIKFCEMGSFIATVRNRFFHNMNGGAKNFDSEHVVDSDVFFEILNNKCVLWISTIFLTIVTHHLAQLDASVFDQQE